MRIMLACNAGMSTSLVVAKMQDAAKAHGKDYKIWAEIGRASCRERV